MAKNQNPTNPGQGGQTRQPRIILRAAADITVAGNTYTLNIDVSAFDNGQPMANQEVTLKERIAAIDTKHLDVNGNAILSTNGTLTDREQIKNFRISLTGKPEERIVTVTIPAIAVTTSANENDPETLVLSRYHDDNGNFRVMVRVLRARGLGLKTAVTLWYRGVRHSINTNKRGEAVFDIPRVVDPGDSDHLTATVSGIADSAHVDVKRRRLAARVAPFTSGWWFGTNNGRAFILLSAILLTWIITFMAGTGEEKINHRLFNDKSGLSRSEQFYNEAAKISVPSRQIVPAEPWSAGAMPFWGWLIIITVLAIIYAIFSLREEIGAGIEDGFEKLFDKSYSKAGDPAFEKIAKFIGSYGVARRNQSATIETVSNSGKPSGKADSGHPSLGTLFKLDLLSDALVAIVPAIFRRLF